MELLKKMQEVDGEEVEVYVDKTGKTVDNPDLTGDFEVVDAFTPDKSVEDVDEKGVSWKNRAKEFERKLEAEKVKNQIASQISATPKINRVQQYREKLEKAGFSQSEIDEKTEILQIAVDEAKDNTAEQIKPVASVKESVNETKREKILNLLEKDAEQGEVVKLHRKDIESELENIPLEYDIPLKTIEMVTAWILWKKKAFISNPETKKKRILDDNEIVSEGGHPSKTKVDGIDIKTDKFQDYVASQGFDISTPEKKAKVIKSFKAKLELDKVRNQE